MIPLVNQVNVSLQTGDPEQGYTFTWHFGDLHATRSATTTSSSCRSIGYAASATVLDLDHRLPAGVLHRLQGGRYKNLLLLLIVLPFFTSYLLRTVAWQLILPTTAGSCTACRTSGSLSSNGRLLATRTAVIAGITYNFLPFMVLPLYVSLEKIDRRLIEAATDLYACARDGVPAGDGAAGAAGHLRRLAADVHPGVRRLHQRRAARDAAAST